ncbi:MAG: hypothetical protein E6R03_15490 [Hyphomicrobiaceae bacterium]|nr:MAG: hypothetical protein E6R03_15490 [Hyphomicrobiaceae bacterium]
MAELRNYNPTLSDKLKWGMQDILMGLGMDAYNSNKFASFGKDVLGLTPVGIPMVKSDMDHAVDAGSPVGVIGAALGLLPAGPIAKRIPTKLEHAALEMMAKPAASVARPAASVVPPGKEIVPKAMPEITSPEEALRQTAAAFGEYTTPAFHGSSSFGRQAALSASGGERAPIAGGYFYSSAEPALAEMYSAGLSTNPALGYTIPQHVTPEIMPLLLNTQDYHVVDGMRKNWTEANGKAITEALALGKPGVTIHNVFDEPGSTRTLGPRTIHITFPEGYNTVRSKFAKFDPAKFNMNDLLAGLAGGGVIAGGVGANGKTE